MVIEESSGGFNYIVGESSILWGLKYMMGDSNIVWGFLYSMWDSNIVWGILIVTPGSRSDPNGGSKPSPGCETIYLSQS